VDEALRQATKAFLAGEHTTAREVFEALLPAVGDGEIDLGQDEMVDEVLTVGVEECAAQYVASVYLTTPLEKRAEALCRTMEAVHGVAWFWHPIEQMEWVTTAGLPELDAFLPRWVGFLERRPEGDGAGDRSGRRRYTRGARPSSSGETGRAACAPTTRRRGSSRRRTGALRF
jgi:hypothetical protein